MGSERDVERKFSEQVDRLLAGEEVKIDAAAEKESGAELDTARKIIALRPAPSSQFQTALKQRLLRKLAEQETATRSKEKENWLWKLLPRQRAWQAAVAMLLIVVVGGIIWGRGIFKPEVTPPLASAPPAQLKGAVPPAASTTPTLTKEAAPRPASAPPVHLKIDASTDRSVYLPGQEVKIEVVLKNVTPEPFVIEQFPPILSLMQAESRQPVYTFASGKAARTLAPDETAEFVLVWNQLDDRGRYVRSGDYYLELEDLDYQGRALQLNFSQPVRFGILPPASFLPGIDPEDSGDRL